MVTASVLVRSDKMSVDHLSDSDTSNFRIQPVAGRQITMRRSAAATPLRRARGGPSLLGDPRPERVRGRRPSIRFSVRMGIGNVTDEGGVDDLEGIDRRSHLAVVDRPVTSGGESCRLRNDKYEGSQRHTRNRLA